MSANDYDYLLAHINAIDDVIKERFDRLEEIIEGQEQQIAGLMAAYVELTAVVDAIFKTLDIIDEIGVENVPEALAGAVSDGRQKMIELLEGVSGTNVEAGDPSPDGPMEDVAQQD